MRYRSKARPQASDVGCRVTVRRQLSEGGKSDVVGELLSLDEHTLSVRDRRGETMTIELADVVAYRVIPPRG